MYAYVVIPTLTLPGEAHSHDFSRQGFRERDDHLERCSEVATMLAKLFASKSRGTPLRNEGGRGTVAECGLLPCVSL